MQNLILIQEEYKSLIDAYVNKTRSAQVAVQNSKISTACVYKDMYEEASHVFEDDYVLIFGDGIYKKVI